MIRPPLIRQSVIFDVGRVLFDWDLRHLFAKLIDDKDRLEWFVTNVVTPEWHFQHDAGRPLAEMVPELKAEFPDHAPLIDAYASRFNETIPGPMPGSLELVERLGAAGVPLFAITNFGHRSEEHTSELQSLMRISYAVFCLKKKKITNKNSTYTHTYS